MADRGTGGGETRPATRETPRGPGLERGRTRTGPRERDRAPRTGPRDGDRVRTGPSDSGRGGVDNGAGGVDRGAGVE